MESLKKALKELKRYPSAIAGMVIIFIVIAFSIYALISIPYDEAVVLWRGSEAEWYQNPKNAPPVWTNWFSKVKQPTSFQLQVGDEGVVKTLESQEGENKAYTITYTFDYQFDAFPQEIMLYFESEYAEKEPFVSAMWITPDGREIRIADFAAGDDYNYRFSQDQKLERRLGKIPANIGLFMIPDHEPQEVIKGEYQLVLAVRTFEADSDIQPELVIHGTVHGLAGTDHLRRDLMVALMWGAPVALAFGLLASVGTTFLTMVIAAVGAWFGGWVDGLIQRVTEINLVLPFLSILIMVGTFYSRSIWVILGVTILLSIFTAGIKTYRAIFMQVKESPYIEAAKSYGASNMRLIFVYLIPRIIPLLIPGLVLAIPTFVFLEASLAVLGLGDPLLPTWGKIINDAQSNSALYNGFYYWIIEPAILLMITGSAFAMLGYSLDRVFNPRLRGM